MPEPAIIPQKGYFNHKCELKKKIYETRLLGAFNKENP